MMIESNASKVEMIRYLLGEMPDSERTNFESLYQNDTDRVYELAELENDLIDLYAAGVLSESEQQRMRIFMADPERQKRLVFARTLARYPGPKMESVPPGAPESGRWLLSWQRSKRLAAQAMAATVAMGMITAVFWLFMANRSLRREVEALRSQQSSAAQKEQALKEQIDTLTRKLEELDKGGKEIEQPPFLAKNTIPMFLRSDVVRGDDPAPTLTVLPSTAFVVFNVTVPGHALSNYGVFLETAEAKTIWSQKNVTGRSVSNLNTQLSIKLQSRVLAEGDYVLRVTTTIGQMAEDVAGYSFHVVRR